ncbi:hypothetical protein RLEG12_03825 (plasmid) [Rhizobium leguminosarum bv. trifolii CB782]|nr:hypothetical protein RLEG12_03825 [Rhizobium leguminosarum bv. trifolii CB782]
MNASVDECSGSLPLLDAFLTKFRQPACHDLGIGFCRAEKVTSNRGEVEDVGGEPGYLGQQRLVDFDGTLHMRDRSRRVVEF